MKKDLAGVGEERTTIVREGEVEAGGGEMRDYDTEGGRR